MIILVCGGRKYDNGSRLCGVLDRLNKRHGIELLIHGNATGADKIARAWAEARGVKHDPNPALWYPRGRDQKMDKSAGHKRNRLMAEKLRAHEQCGERVAIIAFPGGRGTDGMVRIGRGLGLQVWEPEDLKGETVNPMSGVREMGLCRYWRNVIGGWLLTANGKAAREVSSLARCRELSKVFNETGEWPEDATEPHWIHDPRRN